MICSWKAEDPGRLVIYVQSGYKDLRTRKTDGIISSLRAGNWFCFSSSQRRNEFFPPPSFHFIQALKGLNYVTHVAEGSLFHYPLKC